MGEELVQTDLPDGGQVYGLSAAPTVGTGQLLLHCPDQDLQLLRRHLISELSDHATHSLLRHKLLKIPLQKVLVCCIVLLSTRAIALLCRKVSRLMSRRSCVRCHLGYCRQMLRLETNLCPPGIIVTRMWRHLAEAGPCVAVQHLVQRGDRLERGVLITHEAGGWPGGRRGAMVRGTGGGQLLVSGHGSRIVQSSSSHLW